jgi:HEAT repeat protein
MSLKQLTEARDNNDVRYLIDALTDVDDRLFAIMYLIELDARDAVVPIGRLLDAFDPHVRARATEAVGWLGGASFRSRLREIARDDPVDWVRGWAIIALSRLSYSPDDMSLFIESLRREESWKARHTPVIALGRVGDQESIRILRAERNREGIKLIGRWGAYRRAIAEIRRRRPTDPA